jgi:hypothetical protein
MNVGIPRDRIGLHSRGYILDDETNQNGQAVDIGLKLRHFIPQRRRRLRAPNKASMLSGSGW